MQDPRTSGDCDPRVTHCEGTFAAVIFEHEKINSTSMSTFMQNLFAQKVSNHPNKSLCASRFFAYINELMLLIFERRFRPR